MSPKNRGWLLGANRKEWKDFVEKFEATEMLNVLDEDSFRKEFLRRFAPYLRRSKEKEPQPECPHQDRSESQRA